MSYYRYKMRHRNDVVVYIEEYNKQEKTVLFDFIDSNEYDQFTGFTNSDEELRKPSMVLLNNYNQKSIRENTLYAISQDTIQVWRSQGFLSSDNINSFLIGYVIDVFNLENAIFTRSINLDPFFDIGLNYSTLFRVTHLNSLPLSLKGKISVNVRKVGQGNWNEICVNDEVKYVYDAGAPMQASQEQVQHIIGCRGSMYAKSKPGLFLSHWDKDHYHALIGMTDQELSNFSFFVFRNHLPNLTSRILYGRIARALGWQNLFALNAETRIARGGPTFLIPKNTIRNQFLVFNAQDHKDRNISGIVICLKTKYSSMILSGDVHYEQISRDILPHLNYSHYHYVVVPHHGGKAGRYSYNLPVLARKKIAIISVGTNSYRHPLPTYVRALEADFSQVLQTRRYVGDIVINL